MMWTVTLLLAGFLIASPGWAQQEGEAAPAAVPGAEDPEAAVREVLKQWTDLLVELRQLRSEYQTADAGEHERIQQAWDAAIARGEQMIPVVAEKVLAAYQAAPNEDREKSLFLAKVLNDYLGRDRCEAAFQIGQVLASNSCDLPEIYRDAGIAAFAINEYELASQWLERAANSGAMNPQAVSFRNAVTDYTQHWAKEQEIREREAAADDLPRVKLTTSQGDIIVELYENEAPETVANFISLVQKGFYDNLLFHRVLSTFMAQTGCPVGDGTAGPGYTIYDECERPDARRHFRGVLSMAAKPNTPNSGGSQFFITFVPAPSLDGRHTVFGRVIEGMDVVTSLKRIDPADEQAKKVEPDRILSAEVLRARDHEYLPHKVE